MEYWARCFEVDDMMEALEGKGWGGEGAKPNYPKDLTNGLNTEVVYSLGQGRCV